MAEPDESGASKVGLPDAADIGEVVNRRAAKIMLSRETLERMFDLPRGYRVVAVNGSFDPPCVQVLIESSKLPPVAAESEAPIIAAEVRVEYLDEPGDRQKHREFRRWRIEPQAPR